MVRHAVTTRTRIRYGFKLLPKATLNKYLLSENGHLATRVCGTPEGLNQRCPNLSQFTLYVSEVCFMYRHQNGEVLKFVAPAGSQFPIELKERDSMRFQPAQGDIMDSVKHRFSCPFARTACGRTRTGTSPSLQQQELNVLMSTDATIADIAKLRRQHQWERIESYVRSTIW